MMDGKRFEGGRFCFVFGSVPALVVDVTASGDGWVSGETVSAGHHAGGDHVVVSLGAIMYARDDGGAS
jgi:hypothetical protein